MGGGDIVTRAWETATSGEAGTSSAAPGADTSGASRAMWASSTWQCSSWPREDDRAGEMRELLPPFSAEGGTAAASSFLFFAEDVGLINQGRASGNGEHKPGQGEAQDTYRSTLMYSTVRLGSLKPDSFRT